jgi:phosphate transport system substrate-binding protein
MLVIISLIILSGGCQTQPAAPSATSSNPTPSDSPSVTITKTTTAVPVNDLSSYYTIKEVKATDKTLKSIGLTVDNFPVLDGATATQPIRSLIAASAFGAEYGWHESIEKEMFIYADLQKTALSEAEQQRLRAKFDRNAKTHDAYLDLIHGHNDLILVATKPSDDELREAKNTGVRLELFPIGLDGFIFLVNIENPIKNLNTPDIVDIYSGKTKTWQPFTGQDLPIMAFTRQPNSGSQELMEKLIMKGAATDPTLKTEKSTIFSMSLLIEGVDWNKEAIGYSLYYYKNTMIDKTLMFPYPDREEPVGTKVIAVDGVEPNPESIASHQYPYVFNIYAVTRSDQPKDSTAYQVKEWLTSREGQEIVAKAGYIGLGN